MRHKPKNEGMNETFNEHYKCNFENSECFVNSKASKNHMNNYAIN